MRATTTGNWAVLLRSLFWPAAFVALSSCAPGEQSGDPGTVRDSVGLGTIQLAVNGCDSTHSPEIVPDKEDYFPPETVTLTATGLECGATYSVRITTPTQYWPVFVQGGEIISLGSHTADQAGTAVFTYDLAQEFSGNFPTELLDSNGNVIAVTDFHDSHFRYGTISWTKATSPANTANFVVSSGWRRSAFGAPIVGSNVVPITFTFGDNNSVSPNFTVTQIDVANDWIVAVATFTHTYSTAGPFTAGYSSCCRLSTLANNHDGNFQQQTTVRFDLQEAPPVSNLQPIVTAPANAAGFQFIIPRTDNDGDPTTCRLATCNEAYVDATPNCFAAPAGLTVAANTCSVAFSTVGKAVNQLFTATVMIEDHRLINNVDTILSKVPVDFIIQIIQPDANPPACALSAFSPAPASSTSSTATWNVAPNTPISFIVTGTDAQGAVTVSTGSLPPGSIMNPTLPLNGSSPRTSTFSWTPGVAVAGQSKVVNYTVTDQAGQQASCVATINVIGRPIVTVPGNITAEATSSAGAVVTYTATAKDSAGVPLTPTCSPPAGSAFPLGTTTVNCSATDASGQVGTAAFTITVRDTTAPAISCPAPISASCTGNSSATVNVPNATATDAVSLPVVTGPAGVASYPLGNTPLTFRAADAANNQSSCQATVSVFDDTNPTIACPAAITAECTGNHAATVNVPNAVGSDTCSSATVTGPAGSASYPSGTATLSFTATDTSGNHASCTTTITVADTTGPGISCPAPVTAECTGNGSAAVSVPNATATDACGSATVSGPAGSAVYPLGTTALSFNATDDVGNASGCSTSVAVVDTTKPSITCPAPVTAECTGNHAASVDLANATASDICTSAIVSGPAGTSTYPSGTTTVSFSAADVAGNTAACATQVTVVDTQAPSISCPEPIIAECVNAAATVTVPNATGADACGGVAIGGPAGSASYPLGTTTLSFDATDEASHTTVCTTSVQVVDTTRPSISCPVAITAECTGNHAASVDVPDATASDACTSATVSGPAGTSTYPLGTTALTFTAADGAGNTATCAGQVTVVDTNAPLISCPAAITAECTGNGAATVTVPNAGGSDTCGGVTISGPAGSASYPLGSTSLAFTATDEAGLTNGCATSVAVVDTTSPTIQCPAKITAECTGNHAASVDVPNAIASDTCTSATVRGPDGTASYPLGTTELTFTAADSSGNQVSCADQVTVLDTTAPSISCPPPITVECTANGAATVNIPNATGSDVCGSVSVSGPAGSASYPLGTTTLTFNATDEAGLGASCPTTVTVRDTTPPVFDPSTLGAQTVLGNCAGSPLVFTTPKATDGCQNVTVTCDALAGNSLGANTVHCVATDGSGNQASTSITVNVLQPLRLAFQSPLQDDNVADNIATDADVANLFQVKQTIPNQIKVYACDGTNVTTSIAGSVTLRLSINIRSDSNPNSNISIVPNYTGVGDSGGVLVLTGDHFHYNQKTDTANYPAGTVNTANYFDNVVTLTYNSAPSIVAGEEDARLESR